MEPTELEIEICAMLTTIEELHASGDKGALKLAEEDLLYLSEKHINCQ